MTDPILDPVDEPAIGERARLTADLSLLAVEIEPRDGAVAEVLRRLADAVRLGRQDEVRGYIDAIEPRALAELLVDTRAAIWGFVEVARNVLVFAPIAVTWFGLSAAAAAYAKLIERKPDLVTQPFLLLWQQDFPGVGVPLNFSSLALVDAALIGLLIALSLVMHVRTEIRDVSLRTRVLLKESQIRALFGHAVAVSATVGIDLAGGDALLDQMAAEERRIYERAMEREQQLFDLEGAVIEIRHAAEQLTRAAEALNVRATPTAAETADLAVTRRP